MVDTAVRAAACVFTLEAICGIEPRPVAVPTAAHKVMAMLLMKALLPGGLPLSR